MLWTMSRYLRSNEAGALKRACYISIASVALIMNFLIFDYANAATQVNQNKQELSNEAEKIIRERLDQLFDKYSTKVTDPTTQERVKNLGFDQVSDLRNAKAGSPFEVYSVRLDELQGYQVGSDPTPLLHKTNGEIFPLLVSNGQVRSSAMVDSFQKDQGDEFISRVTQLGAPTLIKVLTEFRKELEEKKECAGECFVVWIPSLRRYFLGDKTSEGLKIKVLSDGPGEKLKKGDFLPAEEVFSILKSEAQKNQRYEFPPHDPRFPVR
jgi:cell division protein FtsL